jgi:hypothetical protein
MRFITSDVEVDCLLGAILKCQFGYVINPCAKAFCRNVHSFAKLCVGRRITKIVWQRGLNQPPVLINPALLHPVDHMSTCMTEPQRLLRCRPINSVDSWWRKNGGAARRGPIKCDGTSVRRHFTTGCSKCSNYAKKNGSRFHCPNSIRTFSNVKLS